MSSDNRSDLSEVSLPTGRKRKARDVVSQHPFMYARRDGSRKRHNHRQHREEVFDATHWGVEETTFQERIERLRRCWVRDLTADGDVEGNPGWMQTPAPQDSKSYAQVADEERKVRAPRLTGTERRAKRDFKHAKGAAYGELAAQISDLGDREAGARKASQELAKEVKLLHQLDSISLGVLKNLRAMIEAGAAKERLLAVIDDAAADRNAVGDSDLIKPPAKPAPPEDHHAVIEKALEKSREIHFSEVVPVTEWRKRGLWLLVSLVVLLLACVPGYSTSVLAGRAGVEEPALIKAWSWTKWSVAYWTLIVALAMLVYKAVFEEEVRKHVYRSRLTDTGESVDLRPDALSLGKLLHKRQYKATVSYECRNTSRLTRALDCVSDYALVHRISGLPAKLGGLLASAGEFLGDVAWVLGVTNPLYGLPFKGLQRALGVVESWCQSDRLATWRLADARKEFTVSLELLAQLTTPHVLRRGAKPEWITRRLQDAAQGVHSIAISRFGPYEGEHIMQRTMEFAYALWADMERDGEMLPFPTSPVA